MSYSSKDKYGKQRICFVGLDNYPVLNPACEGYFGGESVQHVLLARAFRDKGYDVHMVVHDHGQSAIDCVEGITVHKSYRKGAGLPVFRFVHPTLTSILRSLHTVNADCYYQSCAGSLTGIVAWYCNLTRKKFVYRAASDSDCIKGKQLISLKRDRIIYEYGLRISNVISVQSIYQQRLLTDNYGLNSVVVDMAVEIPESVDSNCQRDIDVLWVNNLRPLKRVEILFEIAAMLPHVNFVIIGGVVNGQEAYYENIRTKAAKLRNVEFMGQVPYHKVHSFFSRAKLFLNTSEIEGFPNSYLQSWARSVPTVTFFDPDNIIQRNLLGEVPENSAQMASAIQRLLVNESERLVFGRRASQYVSERHAPSVIADSYEQLIFGNNRELGSDDLSYGD